MVLSGCTLASLRFHQVGDDVRRDPSWSRFRHHYPPRFARGGGVVTCLTFSCRGAYSEGGERPLGVSIASAFEKAGTFSCSVWRCVGTKICPTNHVCPKISRGGTTAEGCCKTQPRGDCMAEPSGTSSSVSGVRICSPRISTLASGSATRLRASTRPQS